MIWVVKPKSKTWQGGGEGRKEGWEGCGGRKESKTFRSYAISLISLEQQFGIGYELLKYCFNQLSSIIINEQFNNNVNLVKDLNVRQDVTFKTGFHLSDARGKTRFKYLFLNISYLFFLNSSKSFQPRLID